MVPNGITHQLVQNDQEGAEAILQWLSFATQPRFLFGASSEVPLDTWSMPQALPLSDPVERRIDFRPTKQPYDPRETCSQVLVCFQVKVRAFLKIA